MNPRHTKKQGCSPKLIMQQLCELHTPETHTQKQKNKRNNAAENWSHLQTPVTPGLHHSGCHGPAAQQTACRSGYTWVFDSSTLPRMHNACFVTHDGSHKTASAASLFSIKEDIPQCIERGGADTYTE